MEQNEKYTILTCPHCGDTKEVFNLICADPFIKELWSDLYKITPYMPKIFPVQKCKCCGKYYFIEEEQYHVVDIDAFVDTLNYQELKEAMEELSCSEQSEWEMFMLNRSLIYAYNNEFIRNHNNTPSNEDRQLFMTAIDNLLGFPENYYYPAFRGELLRESGCFDEAVEVLSKLSDVDNIQYYVKPILEHAINHDPLPLLLIKDNNPLYL